MPHEFKLSAFGLRLIKAYEGFRPYETTLVSGQRVIGYGHRYSPDEEPVISQKKAEAMLKSDLEPYEALVNDNIFAPLSQSQFDALVSLAFNIGAKAFLSSKTLHALNQGRPLDAANGFDEWRKSIIDGKAYVVDALVRRRTAEKALFLRPSGGVAPAPRHELVAKQDMSAQNVGQDIAYFEQHDADGYVDQTPYAANPAEFRRREDGPAGTLTLSEFADDQMDFDPVPETPQPQKETQDSAELSEPALDENLSPIAVAALEVSDQLDKLMAEPEAETEPKPVELEQDIDPEVEDIDVVADLTPANEGAHEDYRRPAKAPKAKVRGPDAFIEKKPAQPTAQKPSSGIGAYWVTLILGLTLAGFGLYKWVYEGVTNLDGLFAFLAPAATFIGALLVLGALYYLIKSAFRGD